MRLGLAGLGRMGTAMAGRLRETGHEVVGWNRTPRTIDGVVMVRRPAELVERSDAVITSLFDDVAVQETYLGADGLCSPALDNRLLIDTSTVAPETARRLGAAAACKGGGFVDAPVLGTVEPCRRGELAAMLGGAADAVAQARLVLAPLTRATYVMGPTGSGAAAKLAVNLVMGSYWAALGDALALAARHALDRRVLLDIIAGGPAALAQLPAKRSVLDGERPPVAFSLAGYVKDLRTILSAAAGEIELPVVEGVLRSFETAVEAGLGEQDVVAVARRQARGLTWEREERR